MLDGSCESAPTSESCVWEQNVRQRDALDVNRDTQPLRKCHRDAKTKVSCLIVIHEPLCRALANGLSNPLINGSF